MMGPRSPTRHPEPRRTLSLGLLGLVGIGVAFVLFPLLVGGARSVMDAAIGALVLAAYALAFNLVFARTGQLLLCFGGLAGLAAYTTTLLADRVGLAVLVTVPLATALACGVGATLSWVCVRRGLDTIFVGVVTLAFSLMVTTLLVGGRGLTGGETGLVVTAGARGPLRDWTSAYYVLLVVVVGFVAVHRGIDRSRLGWACRAIADDPRAAELAGVSVARTKVLIAAVASAMVGLTGALHALHEGFVSPSTYTFVAIDVRVLVAIGIGGMGTLAGPVVGALALGLIDDLLRPLGQLRLSVYGAVLLFVFLGARSGLAPAVTAWRHHLRPAAVRRAPRIR